MRWGLLLLAVGLPAQTGCLLSRNVAHNLANEAAQQWDERKLSRQLRADARNAWEGYCSQTGGFFTDEFAHGFRDGYADLLEFGGDGCPPAVPPLRYRRRDYLTPDGHARVRDFYDGFKAGSDVAAASGRRPYLMVPVLVSDPPPPSPPPGTQVPAAASVRSGEQLPAPRRMDATTGLPIPERPTVTPPPNPDPLTPKIPDVPRPKVPDPPPKPRSDASERPPAEPVALRETPVPAPVFRRQTPPTDEPLPGRRVVIE